MAPLTPEQVKAELGVVGELTGQQLLAAGLLRPANLLDVVRNFILFKRDGSRTIKLVARYPQFRAVHKAIERLRTGQTREQNGDHDARGGIIWHTQGSGKSFTMTFLVRKLRTLPDLRRFKVVVVTDRTDLRRATVRAAPCCPASSPGRRARRAKLQRDPARDRPRPRLRHDPEVPGAGGGRKGTRRGPRRWPTRPERIDRRSW